MVRNSLWETIPYDAGICRRSVSQYLIPADIPLTFAIIFSLTPHFRGNSAVKDDYRDLI